MLLVASVLSGCVVCLSTVDERNEFIWQFLGKQQRLSLSAILNLIFKSLRIRLNLLNRIVLDRLTSACNKKLGIDCVCGLILQSVLDDLLGLNAGKVLYCIFLSGSLS